MQKRLDLSIRYIKDWDYNMNTLKEQLQYTLNEFSDPGLGKHYKGKVRENFHLDNEIIMGCLVTHEGNIVHKMTKNIIEGDK